MRKDSDTDTDLKVGGAVVGEGVGGAYIRQREAREGGKERE